MTFIPRRSSFGRKLTITAWVIAVLAIGNVVGVLAQSQFPEIERRIWRELLPWGQNTGPNGEVIWTNPEDLNNVGTSFVKNDNVLDEYGVRILSSAVPPGWTGLPGTAPEDVTPYGWDVPSSIAAAAAQFPLLSVGQCTFSHRGDYDLDTTIYFPQVRICKGPNGEELPPPPGRLLNPVGLAIDGTDVYVSDLYNHRIQVFDFYGRVKPMQFPIGNGVPGADQYNYDTRYPGLHYRPYASLPNGGFSGSQVSAPYGIALDGTTYSGTGPVPPARRLLVADSGNNRVAIFNTDGSPAFLASGEPLHAGLPTPLDSNNQPLGTEAFKPDQIAISPGATVRAPGTTIAPGDPDFLKRIVVTDRQKCWVAILDVGFNLVKTLPADNPGVSQHDSCLEPEGNTSGPGEFSTITAVKLDAAGNIFIADHSQNVVQVFDPSGNHLTWIGKPGGSNPGGEGDLQGPVGLLVDKMGRLAVIDEGNARAVVYGLDNGPAAATFEFQLDTTVAVDDFPMSVEMQIGPVSQGLDPKGRILVTDPLRRSVLRFELPDLVIANLTANQGSLTTPNGIGEFDVVVPKQKVGDVTGVTVTIVADPGNIIVGTPTPSAPVTIAPGQVVHYTFPYTLPPGETRATFTVKAQGNSGAVPVVTPELTDTVRLRCADCTAGHVVYPLPAPVSGPPGAPAVLFPSYPGNGDWYDREVYVRITPTGSIPATHIGWYYEGILATVLGDDIHETPIGPGGFVDVPARIEGRGILHYWPISASGEGDPTAVILNVDLRGPEVNFRSWTPTTQFDGAGKPWYRTAGLGSVPEVVGVYDVIDNFSGPRSANAEGTVRFTQEGRNQGVPINEPDYTDHVQAFDSITATNGRGVNIDNTAPVFTGSPTTITLYISGEDSQGRYVNAGAGVLAAYPTDPLLADGRPGSGVDPTTSVLSNPAGVYRQGDTFTFTATDYAGNSSTHTVTILLTSAVLVGPRPERITFGEPTPAFVPVVTQELPPGVVITQLPTCYVTEPHVNSGLYRIDCSGGSVTNAEFIYGWSDFVIDKARPVVTVTGGTFTYNNTARTATCSVAGVFGVPLTASSFTYSSGSAPVNAGNYSATCDIAESQNYVAASGTGDIIINKATPVVSIVGGPFNYDGTLHPATCTVTGVAGQTLTGAITYAAGSAPRNATTGAAATCSFAGNTNYEAVSANHSIVVNPRPITITAQPKSKLLGALDPALTYTLTSGSLVAGDSITGSLSRVAGELVGNYTITQGTVTAGPNYIVTYVPAVLSILPLNIPPVAIDDAASTTGAAPVTIAVLGNDSDPDAGTLTLTSITQPTGGAAVGVVTTSGNQVVFTPAVGFVGTAVFTYTISDGQGGTATATVRVTVTDFVCTSSTVALVRGAVTINSGSRTEGTIQVMTAADVLFNGGTLVGDLKMLGMPSIVVNGTPIYGSTLGTGAATPTTHKVTINSGTTMGNVVRRTDAVAMPTVTVPPTSAGTRTVTMNLPSDSPGAFSTLKHLTLNSNVGPVAVPAGTYGTFIANSGSAFVIGVAGAVTPSVYNFETLTLNSGSSLQVVGPVIVNLKNSAAFNGNAGSSAHRDWLTLRISSGGLTLDSAVSFYGNAEVPNGAVIINSGTQLVGGLAANTLTLNGTGKLLLVGTCNRPPTVTAPNRTNNEGDTVSVQITGTDPDGDALTYAATGLPPGLSMNANGLITGTLSYASAGVYNVTVTVTDPGGLTGTATFVWTVLNVNRPPTVSAPNRTDMLGATAGGQIIGSDPDGDVLTYSATGLPPGATISSTGVIGGVLTTSGVYTVTVTVKDPSNATGSGTFTWTVLTPNVPPTAANDSATSVGAAPVNITVLTNDSDPDGGTLTVTAITQPSGGASVGVVTTSGNQVVFTPAANFVGTVTFTYTISDGQGGTATATVTVTITAPAVCTTGGYLTYSQGGWGNGGAPGQFLASKFAQVYPAGYVTIGGNYTLKFTSASAIDAFLPAGGSPAVLTASAVNPTSSSAGNFAAQLLAMRLAVDFSAAGVTKTGMGSLVMVSGPFAGSTVDQILAVSNAVLGGQTSALPSGMTVSTLSGILESLNMNFHEGTVNNGLLGCPGTCVAGTITLSADSFATSGTAGNIRTFSGAGVSVKASAFSRTKSTGAWSTAFLGAFGSAGLGVTDGSEGSGTDNSHKVDNIGDRLNYLVFEFSKPVVVTRAFMDYIGADSDATIWVGTKTDPFNNHITLSDAVLTSLGAAQTSTSTSTADRWATFNGTHASVNVLVIAADVTDTTPEDEFKISKLDLVCATQPAVPPTVTAANKSNEEGAAVSVQIAATDPDAQALTYSATGLPAGLSINASTGLITGTLGYSSAGTYNVTISVTDTDEQTATATFVWTVTNKNRPPTVTTATRTDNKGATVSFQLAGTDPDGDAITYSATGLPPGASISTAGVISGTLTTAGTYSVTVTVKDPSNATGTSTFTWTVKVANRAPTVTASNRTDNKGTAPIVQITGTDLDGDALTYSATGLPPGMSMNSAGKITGTLTTAGTYNVTVTVKDPSNATGTATFCWTVKATNVAPVAKSDSLTTPKNTSKTISVIGNDTDANGDTLTITSVSTPSKGTVVKYSNGTIKYTPPSNWTGTTSFTYTISDGNGGSATATVTVTVTSHSSNDGCDDDHDHNGTHNDSNDRRERDCDRNHRHTEDCDRSYRR